MKKKKIIFDFRQSVMRHFNRLHDLMLLFPHRYRDCKSSVNKLFVFFGFNLTKWEFRECSLFTDKYTISYIGKPQARIESKNVLVFTWWENGERSQSSTCEFRYAMSLNCQSMEILWQNYWNVQQRLIRMRFKLKITIEYRISETTNDSIN